MTAMPEQQPVRELVSTEDRKRLVDRLARIEGQLRGVQKMIAGEAECEAVAQQLAAAQGALRKAFAEFIACALERRMREHRPDGETPLREELEEITGLLSKYV